MCLTVWMPFEQTLTTTIVTKPHKEIKTADKLDVKLNVTGKKQNVAKNTKRNPKTTLGTKTMNGIKMKQKLEICAHMHCRIRSILPPPVQERQTKQRQGVLAKGKILIGELKTRRKQESCQKKIQCECGNKYEHNHNINKNPPA